MVGFVLVLGLGGTLAEHLVSAAGLNPTTPKPSSTVPPTTVLPGAPSISSPLPAFMGLVPERPISGYNFSLVDETGAPLSLGDERGKVVVLSFFDGRCDDICPVLASELRAADRDLGSAAKHVVFLTVNSDPGATAVADLAPAVRATRLSSLGNWHLLTGPLSELNTVWTHYGLQVTMVSKTGMVAHNDVIYFVDPDGHLRYQATPFANESRSGVYQLPGADIARFGSGIALYASRLVRSP